MFHYFVICLTENKDRMENVSRMKDQLPGLIVVDAIKATEDIINKLKTKNLIYTRNGQYIDSFNRPYRPGSIGNFLSHKQLLKHISSTLKEGYAIIMEDDIKLLPEFEEKLIQKVLPILENTHFDMAHLNIMDFQKSAYIENNSSLNDVKFVRSPPGFCGTHCYVVKPQCIHNILNAMKEFRDPIDEQLTRDPYLKIVHLVGLDMIEENNSLPSLTTCLLPQTLPFEASTGKLDINTVIANIADIPQLAVPYLPDNHPLYSKLVESQCKKIIIIGHLMVHSKSEDIQIYIIDSFQPTALQLIGQHGVNMSLKGFKKLLKDVGQDKQVTLVPLISIEAVELFAHYKTRVNMIYHARLNGVRYHQVKLDLILYWNILEEDGYMLGGDFDNPQIAKAVQEFASERHLFIEVFPTWVTWCIRKPSIKITNP